MNLIVAVDNNWAIGYQNKILVNIPEDMQLFRKETTGKVVIMGRKTLESFPNGLPLRDRINIVMTKEKNKKIKDAIVCHSVEEVLEETKKYNSDDIFVIGGESVYRELLPYCKVAHVTKIDYKYQADTKFVNLDEMPDWQLAKTSEEKTYFDLEYEFRKYVRKSI